MLVLLTCLMRRRRHCLDYYTFHLPYSFLLSNFPPSSLFDLQLRKANKMPTSERFDCHYCKDSLLGKKYIMKEDTQYCTKCYENLFANSCEACSLPIGCNCKVRKQQCSTEKNAASYVTGLSLYIRNVDVFSFGLLTLCAH